MADAFNAYHVWLGIPPKDQPANHYRLLGLEVFESEPGVIDNAADRQMAHVRRHQSGRHAEQSQRILNEISAARVCLLNPARKAEYDAELRRRLTPPAYVPLGVPVVEADKSHEPTKADEPQGVVEPPLAARRAAPPPLKSAQRANGQAGTAGVNGNGNGLAHAARETQLAVPPPLPRHSRVESATEQSEGRQEPPAAFPWRMAALVGGAALAGLTLAASLLIAVVLWLSGGDDATPKLALQQPVVSTAAADSTPAPDASHDPEQDPSPSAGRDVIAAEVAPPPPVPVDDPLSELPPEFELRPLDAATADLLAAVDPRRDKVSGTWLKDSDGPLVVPPPDRLALRLLNQAPPVNLLAAPIAPPPAYELKLTVTRREGAGPLGLGLVVGDDRHHAMLFFDGAAGDDLALGEAGGKSLVAAPPEGRAALRLALDTQAELVVRVEQDQIAASVDGIAVVDWRGDVAELAAPKSHAIPHAGALYVAAEDASFTLNRFELTRIDPPSPVPMELPAPLARWTFNEDFRDAVGELHAAPQGSPKIRGGRLWLDGSSFLVTPPLAKGLTEKTLEVWVAPAALDRRDGGVMSVSQDDGRGLLVDALVYAERDERIWQASTDRRRRPPRRSGEAESGKPGDLLHLALVYAADGTVALYRNGKPYGAAETLRDAAVFEAGIAQVAFGRRAPPAYGLFVGAIDQAQLFDRALSAEQLEKLAATPPEPPLVVVKELLHVPDAAELAAAQANVRLLYKDEFAAAKTPPQKHVLAQRLLEVAAATTSNNAGRYALLLAAQDAFAQSGDVEGALTAVDRLAADFDVDAYALKREIVPVAVRGGSGASPAQLAKSAKQIADEALRRDDFETARQLLAAAYSAARVGKSFALARELSERQKQVAELSEKFAGLETALATLETNPDDAEANLAVGLYRACAGGDWVTGLSHLARVSDESLRSLAELEGSAPTAPLDQIKLGDGWWDAAENVDAAYRAALRQRAAHWYRLAAPRLEGGLEKLVAERRIQELEAAQNDGWRVIFRASSPALWNTAVDSEEAYAVPLAEVPESVKFVRLRRTDSDQHVILPIGKTLLAEGGAISQRLLWRNEIDRDGVQFLGAANSALMVSTAGQPYIGNEGRASYAGWGFGGLWQNPTGRSVSWAGMPLTDVEIEIAIKSEDLSPEEAKALLR